jgi:membrane-associated phospholipid phosphatase
VSVAYSIVLAAVCAIFRARIPGWPLYAAAHLALAALPFALARATSRAGRFVRDFDMMATVPAFFFMACQLVHRVHPTDYDPQLIAADRAIGGLAVLQGMGAIESAWLTRVSKGAWISYFFLPLIPAIALYRREDRGAFREAKTMYLLGWLVSYLLYFAVPAEGPGYHPQAVGVAQPAWDETSSRLKGWIHALEGEARDTFPSGHVIIAAVTVFLCLRRRLRAASVAAVPLALAVVWSTLYLRYHYLVDVLAGLLVAAICVPVAIGWHRRVRGRPDRMLI